MSQTTAGTSDIERDLDSKRSRLDANLSALQQKLSPGQMFDQGLDFFRSGNGAEFAQNFGRSMRDAPLPVALVGVGLAWLLVSGAGTARRETHGAGPSYDDLSSRFRGAGEGGLGGSERGLGQRGSDLAGNLSDRGRAASDSIRSGVGNTADQMRGLGGDAWESFQRNPLLAAAFGISAGAVLAALLPASRAEQEYLGEAGAALRDRAVEASKPLADKAQRVASEVGDAAKRSAADEGLTGSTGGRETGAQGGEGARSSGSGSSPDADPSAHVRVSAPSGLATPSTQDDRGEGGRVEPVAAGMSRSSERRS